MRVNIKDFQVKEAQATETFFTTSKYAEFFDDQKNALTETENPNTFAKRIKNKLARNMKEDIKFSYFIKCNPNKELLNPFDTHSTVKDKQPYSALNKVCKTESLFVEVAESIFNQYVSFLRTNNKNLLTSAQRELG